MAKKGRPTKYTKEIANTICEKIAKGEALANICDAESIPHVATVYRWLDAHKDFRDLYARAREDQADFYADEIITIADDCGEDSGEVAKARLQTDNRKWVASKLRPKKYGDSTQVKHADFEGKEISVADVLNRISGKTSGLPNEDS